MRILIAEADEDFRQMLCVVLHDHDVFVAKDGAEAVALTECRLPDIILMDAMMPEVDGFTALGHLAASEITAHIPVLLMSAGYVRWQRREDGLNLGAVDYLQKPFPLIGLPKLLEGYVEKAKKKSEV